ncbi:phosphodiester glycosidase family protein [Bacillus sp. Marseille-Q3570]|uniref:phosphodiester glycosidase family protein n=1 Tax=Bacillus sp. Marseille-Q3570 TaxID=2963522 RepID=UPI0021B7ECDD|nr:phosphodiester glycosidase family protein [Bacillus sp. Marseille-Q3570]
MVGSMSKKALVSIMAITTMGSASLHMEMPDEAYAKNISTVRASEKLSIGYKELPETRNTTQLVKGVTHTEIERGYRSEKSYFTIDAGFYDTKEDANQAVKSLKEQGYEAKIHQVENSKGTDVEEKMIGYVVYSGQFKKEEEAKPIVENMKDDGFENVRVIYSDYDGTIKTTGPWEIDVIEIDPDKFEGELTNALANGEISGKETVSSIAQRKNAIAGINGGYFVVGTNDGVPGDLAGISVTDGKLVSESIGGRTSFLLNENRADIGETETKSVAETLDGKTEVIDGINRQPGLIRSCGGNGDEPTDKPKHDVTCTDTDELIQYNADFGANTPTGKGYEVVLNDDGTIVETRDERGGEIPKNSVVLAATGEKAEWLQNASSIGEDLDVGNQLFIDGKRIDTNSGLDVVNGGPRLLENGTNKIQADEEGFHWSDDFYYHFGLYRHPRTLAGVKENGNILLVTIDGRNPESSIGVNFYESAELLKSLGAVEGMNLDGGGSSTMVVNGGLVNHPSDTSGERAVGDGIFILK